MNKPVLVLSAALAGSVAIAVIYERDLQRERARADALAERLLEFEPLERSDGSIVTRADAKGKADAYAAVQQTIEPPAAQPLINAPEQARSMKEYQGTSRTRQQVERLQSALASGTPLQDYQIQPLITAIDDVRDEMEEESAEDDGGQGAAPPVETQTAANQRIIQAAADILFESQLETLIELLDGELEVERMR